MFQNYSPLAIRSPISLTSEGFTLIEMSIVLIIIGLIVGGILVGRDLIKSSETQAQITQIQKYNSAVHAFQNKYGGLPGDLQVTLANNFGLAATGYCNGSVGYRDGNGLIDGNTTVKLDEVTGEDLLFWADLSIAGLIDSTFPNGGASIIGCGANQALSTTPGTTYLGDFIPSAKIGYGNFVYVYEINGFNWFGVSAVTSTSSCCATMYSGTSISVNQAYSIDKKVDDGLPATGGIVAVYINGSNSVTSPVNAQSSDSSTSCYNSTTNAYSTSISNGVGQNCALSFRFY